MASKKISELTSAGALTGAELVEAVQGGLNVKTTTQDIADLGGGAVDSVNSQTGVVVLDAGDIGFTPVGSISATDVQAAIAELDATVTSISPKVVHVAVTDEVTPIGSGTGKVSFRMPYAMTLTSVRASLVVAQASGSIFTVDINESGTSILSTKLTLDNTESTSTTAATPAVISDSSLADDSIITVDVDQIGNGTAIGLKITLIGT